MLVQAGAAVMLLQKEVTPTSLLDALRGLLTDTERRAQMAVKARSLAKEGALDKIAEMVMKLGKPGE